MDRRAFVTGLGAVLVAPLAAEAQATPARLAMLLTGSAADAGPEYAAFTKELSNFGWVEGQNLVIERRWTDAPEKFNGVAAEAVRAKPTVILTAGPYATRAAQQATATIPIVMIASSDPRVVGIESLRVPVRI